MGHENRTGRAADVIARLREVGATLAVAESCTGGWLGRDLTAVPGASAVFWGGVIAYDNAAKQSVLSVPRQTLLDEGAVSEDVARSMARGVARLSGATWGIGITGIAGPEGGTPEKPVGTVCIAVEGPQPRARTYRLEGDRDSVRREAVDRALALLGEALETE